MSQIDNYLRELKIIYQEAKSKSLSDEEIDRIHMETFKSMQRKSICKKLLLFFTRFLITITFLIACITILYIHQPTTSLILRNVQSLIYPGLKFLRYLSLPIIILFPSLTKFYDETCLVENPYFQVNNLDCWPCSSVHSIINVTGLNSISLHETGTPFITTENDRIPVSYEDIISFYSEKSVEFDGDIGHLESNNKDSLMGNATISKLHVSWRINRLLPARNIRKLFSRPKLISAWSGQSIERYVFIDGPKSSPYKLTNLECPYVFLIQSSGQRTIKLIPTKECLNKCRSVSIVLRSKDILWYNWWYWKPVSLPSENATNVSVSYMNSYC